MDFSIEIEDLLNRVEALEKSFNQGENMESSIENQEFVQRLRARLSPAIEQAIKETLQEELSKVEKNDPFEQNEDKWLFWKPVDTGIKYYSIDSDHDYGVCSSIVEKTCQNTQSFHIVTGNCFPREKYARMYRNDLRIWAKYCDLAFEQMKKVDQGSVGKYNGYYPVLDKEGELMASSLNTPNGCVVYTGVPCFPTVYSVRNAALDLNCLDSIRRVLKRRRRGLI